MLVVYQVGAMCLVVPKICILTKTLINHACYFRWQRLQKKCLLNSFYKLLDQQRRLIT
uniref:Uncharacterized protein n=1 Tax=Arundo donax TaxID=35708 RepID=A0A0A9DYV7_ARUDO